MVVSSPVEGLTVSVVLISTGASDSIGTPSDSPYIISASASLASSRKGPTISKTPGANMSGSPSITRLSDSATSSTMRVAISGSVYAKAGSAPNISSTCAVGRIETTSCSPVSSFTSTWPSFGIVYLLSDLIPDPLGLFNLEIFVSWSSVLSSPIRF